MSSSFDQTVSFNSVYNRLSKLYSGCSQKIEGWTIEKKDLKHNKSFLTIMHPIRPYCLEVWYDTSTQKVDNIWRYGWSRKFHCRCPGPARDVRTMLDLENWCN